MSHHNRRYNDSNDKHDSSTNYGENNSCHEKYQTTAVFLLVCLISFVLLMWLFLVIIASAELWLTINTVMVMAFVLLNFTAFT